MTKQELENKVAELEAEKARVDAMLLRQMKNTFAATASKMEAEKKVKKLENRVEEIYKYLNSCIDKTLLKSERLYESDKAKKFEESRFISIRLETLSYVYYGITRHGILEADSEFKTRFIKHFEREDEYFDKEF